MNAVLFLTTLLTIYSVVDSGYSSSVRLLTNGGRAHRCVFEVTVKRI